VSVFPGDARQHRGRDEACVNRSRKSKALRIAKGELRVERESAALPVCTENLIRVDDVMESLKLAE